jgi:hypothetical protein
MNKAIFIFLLITLLQSCKDADLVFKNQGINFENANSYYNADLDIEILVMNDSLIITNFRDLNIYLVKDIALNKIGTYYYSDSLIYYIDTFYGTNPTAGVIDRVSRSYMKPLGYTYFFDSLNRVTNFKLNEIDSTDLDSNLNLIWNINKYSPIQLKDKCTTNFKK